MTVLKSKRPESKAEFVYKSRQLTIYSANKAKGLEKSLTFFGRTALYETARKVNEHLMVANSIYPTCKDDCECRRQHLRDARAFLYYLVESIGIMEELSSNLSHKSAQYWGGLCYELIGLVTGVMRSDAKRFKSFYQ